ncbi:exopolysaccharide biosynthesis protein [Marinobacter sp. chi1]|uniref:Exopolysaccharide biosynthesis protein n=1 Tax=Marinobacter suaedae TaxID=3057675 RepID=A0ABT8VY87_9GAMM|nr:exopolysaccharide biosynthesis protein [Marinobacter sp. chi1]MDO3720936.1 exopolysaccharide biosynthesis protein [Marinobacter sp. chi1]
MPRSQSPASLTDVLNLLRANTRGQQQVSIGDVLDAVGQRSFGPVVLIAGLLTLAPLVGDLPGVPTLLGLLVLLTLGQLPFQQQSIWIPSHLSRRQIERHKLTKGLDWIEKPARFIDRWTSQRLTWLVRGPGRYLTALICMLVAAALPAMELVPFSANGGGLALTLFGIALVADDGLFALLGILFTGGTLWMVISGLMGL